MPDWVSKATHPRREAALPTGAEGIAALMLRKAEPDHNEARRALIESDLEEAVRIAERSWHTPWSHLVRSMAAWVESQPMRAWVIFHRAMRLEPDGPSDRHYLEVLAADLPEPALAATPFPKGG